jgi:phosphoserine aminotransferase
MSTANVSVSQLAAEYVIIPVNATKSGTSYNPTNDVVQFAFVANPSGTPSSSQWVSGSWDVSNNAVYPYLAQCLVGTAGTILGQGTYIMWMKIFDNPETPVQQVGTLTIF